MSDAQVTRIYSLRDLINECRSRLPACMRVIDAAMKDESPQIRLQAITIAMAYGWGRPAQQVVIHEKNNTPGKRILVLPENHRGMEPNAHEFENNHSEARLIEHDGSDTG